MVRGLAFLFFVVFSLFEGAKWFSVFSCLMIYENDVDVNNIVIFPYFAVASLYFLLLWFSTLTAKSQGLTYLISSAWVIVISIALPKGITLIVFEISSLFYGDISCMLRSCDIGVAL